MSTIDRRTFHRMALGGVLGGAACSPEESTSEEAAASEAAPAKHIDSTVARVRIGCQSYSFRDRSRERAIEGFVEVGIGVCELYSGHVEPEEVRRDREQLRQWRETVSLDHFEQIGKQFRDAGIDLYAFNCSFRDDFSDREIERGFEMAQAMGAKVLTASSNVSTAKRIDPFAKKHRMRVGMHNHSRIRENEFATPADFAAARKGASDYIAVNLDIGHFTAANFDPVDYIDKHHADIVTLHIKDRKRDQGDNMPFGEGDTKIVEVLQLLREKKYPIPANIEYEYKGDDTVEEVRRCFAYCKKALLS